MKPIHALPIALAVATLVVVRRAAGRVPAARPSRHRSEPRVDPDCEVTECGADGVPLSSYAG